MTAPNVTIAEHRIQRRPSVTGLSGPRQCTLGDWHGPDGYILAATLEPANPMPAGRYLVQWRTTTPKHPEGIYQLVDVPGHTAIQVHIGNTAPDTEDCVLTGTHHGYLSGAPAVLDSSSELHALEHEIGDDHPDFYLTLSDPESR